MFASSGAVVSGTVNVTVQSEPSSCGVEVSYSTHEVSASVPAVIVCGAVVTPPRVAFFV